MKRNETWYHLYWYPLLWAQWRTPWLMRSLLNAQTSISSMTICIILHPSRQFLVSHPAQAVVGSAGEDLKMSQGFFRTTPCYSSRHTEAPQGFMVSSKKPCNIAIFSKEIHAQIRTTEVPELLGQPNCGRSSPPLWDLWDLWDLGIWWIINGLSMRSLESMDYEWNMFWGIDGI